MKKLTKVIMSGAAVAALSCTMAFGFAACGNNSGEDGEGNDVLEFIVEGSTSMEEIMLALVENFQESYEEETGLYVDITVTASGSGSGISHATDGTALIGMSSRALSTTESQSLESQTICLDGIAVVVNPNCSLTSVTKTQLVDLYTQGTAIGSVVAALRREDGSGTRDGFQDALGIDDEDLITDRQGFEEFTSTSTLKTAIAGNNAGTMIGYISMASVDNTVKALAYDDEDPTNGTEAAAPTVENVLNGSYGLARPFVICYQSYDALPQTAKDFVDYIMSTEGQQIIEAHGGISQIL